MADYIPNTADDREAMLKTLNLASTDDLFAHLPAEVLLKRKLDIPAPKTEIEVKRHLAELSGKNTVYGTCFLGAGAYNHFVPSVVKQIASREEFVTGYTPYQAEMSQGVLQSIFEYQTMMCRLTGLDVSNASVYDGATAVAEAVMMCTQGKKNTALVSAALNPEYLKVLNTWCEYCEVNLVTIPVKNYVTDMDALAALITQEVGAVVLQNPNFFGSFEQMQEASDMIHQKGAKMIATVNPISLAICQCPADYRADIAVGEGQPLGNALGGGGPYLGFMVATQKLMRKLPGRIVGQTLDTEGKRGFVLTLQAREQHIRREKASSNICSNQALNALTAAVYLSAMGNAGLKEVANISMNNAQYLRDGLAKVEGASVFEQDFFNEFVVKIEASSGALQKALDANDILGGYALGDNHYLYCATELNTDKQMDKLCKVISEVCHG